MINWSLVVNNRERETLIDVNFDIKIKLVFSDFLKVIWSCFLKILSFLGVKFIKIKIYGNQYSAKYFNGLKAAWKFTSRSKTNMKIVKWTAKKFFFLLFNLWFFLFFYLLETFSLNLKCRKMSYEVGFILSYCKDIKKLLEII